jgi:hypothetical protein
MVVDQQRAHQRVYEQSCKYDRQSNRSAVAVSVEFVLLSSRNGTYLWLQLSLINAVCEENSTDRIVISGILLM